MLAFQEALMQAIELWDKTPVSILDQQAVQTHALLLALGKYITPAALFWFRWSAMSTIVLGAILAYMNGYLLEAYTLDAIEGFSDLKNILIGTGMWLGTIMWFNVWFIIWPNQQKALNINNAYASLPADQKAKAARTAGQASRINTMLSIPMLFCMVAATHIFTG